MRVLVQRSGLSRVFCDGKITGKIDNGLVLFVGFTEGDDINSINYMINKVLHLRIFPDEDNIMNKNILDFGGDILSISQFTLYGDARKSNRPSYIRALNREDAVILFNRFNEELSKYIKVETGSFGNDMDVFIENIGPTTILLER